MVCSYLALTYNICKWKYSMKVLIDCTTALAGKYIIILEIALNNRVLRH